jgi:predicted RNA binding protein YcfA (HicA-like mRNA interferase family)
MPRAWPPLQLREVLAILSALGFSYKNSRGGHDFYVTVRAGKKYKVTVDPKCAPFDQFLLQSMCKQAGANRAEFYGATPGTAAKISM